MKVPKFSFPVPGGAQQYVQYKKLNLIALRMTQAGWRVDRKRLAHHHQAAIKRQQKYGGKFTRITGVANLGQDGQTNEVKSWFWEVKKVPVVSVDRHTRKPKLDAVALLTYASEAKDEEVQRASVFLYGYRKAGKTLGFCKAYNVDRVYPRFNVTGTKGSRWSSSEPNIQQCPSKDVADPFEDGALVAVSLKDIFVPDDGFILIDADYAALELYLQTYIAGASKLIEAISHGDDLHMLNARILFGPKLVPADATKKTHKLERDVAKLAFGFAYNASEHVTQVYKQMRGKMPQLTERIVATLRNRYFQAHPEFMRWQEATKQKIDTLGYVDTPLLQRRLYLEGSMRGYNQGLNSQCQITGGDLINTALCGLYDELRWDEGECIRAQVHDSLVLQTRPEWVKETAAKLVKHMAAPVTIFGRECKFVAEPAAGLDWKNLKDIELW